MTPTPADLSSCDTEPIHVPGTIQPHGVLLAFREPDMTVLQASANAGELLRGEQGSVVGRAIAALFGPGPTEQITRALEADDLVLENPLALELPSGRFDGVLHRNGAATILELEPVPADGARLDRLLRDAVTRLQRANAVDALCETAAEQIRALTGFDRVMVYRFHSDAHGEVVAEARATDIEPFLGHHFPAADIPRQARQLYTLNPIRVIPDARYTPVPLLGAPGSPQPAPLDLTFASLRSVSPIHLEYLSNMGVVASMSVSILRGGRLWGLFACHHRVARNVPFVARSACEVVGRLVSLQMDALEERRTRAERDALRGGESILSAAMRSAPEGWGGALLARSESLLNVLNATGAAILDESGIRTTGDVPPIAAIAGIIGWLSAAGTGSFVTTALSHQYGPAEAYGSVACGLLAVRIPKPGDAYILWFRHEVLRTLTWGGDPSKATSALPGDGRVHPRRSFAAWKEIVRGTSAPWTPAELEIAEDIARRAVESDLERQIARAEKAIRARDDLVAVVSHDLKSPVNVILMATLRARQQNPDPGAAAALARIDRATRRMSVLITDLLDLAKIEAGRFQLQTARCDARSLVHDAILLHTPIAEERLVALESAIDDVHVTADRDRLFQVLANLVGNALKFVRVGGVVKVAARASAGFAHFEVEDDGPGIPSNLVHHVFDRYWQAPNSPSREGSGLGLYIAKGLVEAHGGRIWVKETSPTGTVFAFTIPLSDAPPSAPPS